MSVLRILLSGASGRMGQQIERLVGQDPNFEIAGRADHSRFFGQRVAADVLIDFSLPELCHRALDYAFQHRVPMVIGTTGIDTSLQHQINAASSRIPICQAANFSIGIEVMRSVISRVAAQLGKDFDIEITETHHRGKRDAPSGTALLLVNTLTEPDADVTHGRSGSDCARTKGEITMHALRGGDVVGEHSVHFLGSGERIDIVHRATDRSLFARGALRAAQWLFRQPPGRYDMQNVLNDAQY